MARWVREGGRFVRKQQQQEPDAIPTTMEQLERALNEHANLERNFDLVFRRMEFAGKQTAFLYINGLVKDEVLTLVLNRLTYVKQEELSSPLLRDLMEQYIPHIQVDEQTELGKTIELVLGGGTAMFLEGDERALLIDAKSFPSRSVAEPDLERVVRGSRDGFVETLMMNVALVRRRIRDPKLVLEMTNPVGARTRSHVCLGFIDDIADLELVQAIRDKIAEIDIDGIPLAEKQLEEIIVARGWNPYPLVRYTERPDVVAAHLLEGHIIVFVDTSPSVMILPTTLFHHVQHAEEYRQTPFIGSYLRWIRYVGIFASLFLLPLWFLLVANPELKPPELDFLGPAEKGELPLVVQFLIVEVGVDLMRMAAIHTPTPLATAMGLVAAILVGDIAVQTGLFVNEVILYMAVAAVGMFATPSYELGLANRIVRLALIVLVALFQVPGLVIGVMLWILLLALSRSYNSPYMWPFIPFNPTSMLALILRRPILNNKLRPGITKPQQSRKQP